MSFRMWLKDDGRHPTKGWGPFKSIWLSICSRHYVHDPKCSMCQAGGWYNVTIGIIEAIIWKWRPFALWFFNTRFIRKHWPQGKR